MCTPISSAVAFLLMVYVALAAEPKQPEVADKLGDYETIYEVGVRFRPPKDFDFEPRFNGFGNRETHCLLMAQSLPVAFHEDFDKHAASLKEKKILSREKISVGGEMGILLHHETKAAKDDADGNQLVWDLVFGNRQDTKRVTGTYYAKSSAGTSEVLKAAVLSAGRDDSLIPKPGEKLPFTLHASPKLKLVTKQWRDIVLTEDGDVPPKSGAPIFTAIQFNRRQVPFESAAEFSQLMQRWENDWAEQFEVKSSAEVSIGGLKGYELTMQAQSKKKKTRSTLYYMALPNADKTYLLTGMCGAEKADELLPEFKSMAHSLKLKAKE